MSDSERQTISRSCSSVRPSSEASGPNFTLREKPVCTGSCNSSEHLSQITVTVPSMSLSTPMKWPDFSTRVMTSRPASRISEFSKPSKNSFPTRQRNSVRPCANPFKGTINSLFIVPINRFRDAKIQIISVIKNLLSKRFSIRHQKSCRNASCPSDRAGSS